MTVGHDLKFNVTRIDDQFFEINLRICEGLLRFVTGAVKAGQQTRFIVRSPHPVATAAGNVLVQAISRGEVASLAEGRRLLERSVRPREFVPRRRAAWAEAARRYQEMPI